ncbi:HD domain-containing protein [Lactobacillus sp.] [Lactiplantibacillus mudanjiangensis]|uniref:bis(5'-nucleosyl)-tetraphosphatase (symmetrical) YqeK n=1 Tax=Lactiplantibacillus mudanjiangensis TaxID=1296538 RepID=UPI00101448EB|nr:bis(5'-nucleosyl)-tetraphosphatase (symmetrical) YqeK [Lactiplantibacillus mudanjiangensis]VDG19882.1 HD domain-containing protein [Lactobacillus sp.] [Lactiplantibacillus mudanjiangensis]VDG31304.1 HD domain-containing protein [Lactobacillus sp.] [Lactiplantibacillus mudanjiangensis]
MSKPIEYQENLVPYTHDELMAKVAAKLTPARYQHCLRVEQTARELAAANGVDPELAAITGLLHDYAKQRDDATFIELIKTRGLDPELVHYGNGVWHGVVGAELIKDELHIANEDILQAVRLHTVGAPYMSKLAQITFMADFIEPNRDFPGVEEARKLTKQSLAAGVRYQIQHTLAYLVEKGQAVYPQTLATYNAWVGGVGTVTTK